MSLKSFAWCLWLQHNSDRNTIVAWPSSALCYNMGCCSPLVVPITIAIFMLRIFILRIFMLRIFMLRIFIQHSLHVCATQGWFYIHENWIYCSSTQVHSGHTVLCISLERFFCWKLEQTKLIIMYIPKTPTYIQNKVVNQFKQPGLP